MATGQLRAERVDPWPDARGRAAGRFLDSHGLGCWRAEARPQDASFRRYARVFHLGGTAILMDSPPGLEDCGPFLAIAERLAGAGLPAPRVLAADAHAGFLLLEDFGDELLASRLARRPHEEVELYRRAGALLADVQAKASPQGLPVYDLAEYRREVDLFLEWFAGPRALKVDSRRWAAAWEEALKAVLSRQQAGPVLVLRDYHSENIMLTPDGRLGLIDFQDALAGHPAYDLVSLADDARRDVSPKAREALEAGFAAATGLSGASFAAEAAVISAQRLLKIVGVFHRLEARDGRRGYVARLPRVWRRLHERLAHPTLAPVAQALAAAGVVQGKGP